MHGMVIVRRGKEDCAHENTMAYNPNSELYSKGMYCPDCDRMWGFPQAVARGTNARERQHSLHSKRTELAS